MFTGLVLKSTGSWYEVLSQADGLTVKARIRGRLRLAGSRSTNPVVVGDRVECSVSDSATGSTASGPEEVWIERILPRRNYIIRRSPNLSRESHIIAANIDRALVIATLFAPETSPEFIDRFLVTCEAYAIPVTIVLNKMDLVEASEEGLAMAARFTEIYRRAGYDVLHASSVTGRGIDRLRELLQGRTTLVSGNSGVGKSTLIKAVKPGLDIRTGAISRAHGKGMHTTTFSQMYPLSAGRPAPAEAPSAGFIIDTPGIKGFGLIDIAPEELARYFPDLALFAPRCAYYNCTHTHEPDCAVRAAVEAGDIAEERYISYLKMLEEDGKHR